MGGGFSVLGLKYSHNFGAESGVCSMVVKKSYFYEQIDATSASFTVSLFSSTPTTKVDDTTRRIVMSYITGFWCPSARTRIEFE